MTTPAIYHSLNPVLSLWVCPKPMTALLARRAGMEQLSCQSSPSSVFAEDHDVLLGAVMGRIVVKTGSLKVLVWYFSCFVVQYH